MDKTYFLSQSISLTLVILISLIFVFLGFYNSKKYQDLNNYLTANRNIGLFSLTTSLTASALGAWILFGPASAATWGGIGAIIGYSLGTAFPMFFLIYLGKKIRKELPRGSSLIEFMRKRFRKSLFKLILLMIIFYMFIFLCAEVTAVAILINYISGTELWITALIILMSTLAYTLYGGLRASIFTDNIQMVVIGVLLLISLVYINSSIGSEFSFEFINEKNPQLLSLSYVPGYTAGLTFFIAVFATNLFDQGIWQRVYAAKNIDNLKKGFIGSFFIVFCVIFLLGLIGIYASITGAVKDPSTIIFSILVNKEYIFLNLLILILSLTLVLSSLDTLIASISSLFIIHSQSFIKIKNIKYLFITSGVILAGSALYVSSKGLSILYLFLLADLLCCSAAIPIFYGFYNNKIKSEKVYFSILLGVISGLLFFPSLDFSKSILVGGLLNKEIFPIFISNYLLFWSFVIGSFSPIIFLQKN